MEFMPDRTEITRALDDLAPDQAAIAGTVDTEG